MSKPGRNDRHNTDPIEGKLIRIGITYGSSTGKPPDPRRTLSTLRSKQFGKRSESTASS